MRSLKVEFKPAEIDSHPGYKRLKALVRAENRKNPTGRLKFKVETHPVFGKNNPNDWKRQNKHGYRFRREDAVKIIARIIAVEK